MFNSNRTLIEVFIEHSRGAFTEAFPTHERGYGQLFEQAALTALETVLNCDCAYHDINHTLLVTDVGQTMLKGRQIALGDVTPHAWLHAVIAMLFHDTGYLRGLLHGDRDGRYVIDASGTHVDIPPEATDAALTTYHVDRGVLFVRQRFAHEQALDVDLIGRHIEMTRYPVPDASFYQRTNGFGALVRSADLLGQMADPLYLQKLARLYAELVETGEAERLGYRNAREMRDAFPAFYYRHVQPYIGEGLEFLSKTQEGHQWVANLNHHLHATRGVIGKPWSSH
ncbi:MAG: hypothetical protein QF515_01935 [Pseudomonadales bacterium]|nr:hypothetical protein [Pseudomonadales bacterium]